MVDRKQSFEVWASNEGYTNFDMRDGRYIDEALQIDWEVWQEAREACEAILQTAADGSL